VRLGHLAIRAAREAMTALLIWTTAKSEAETTGEIEATFVGI
jgi:hypothetical protein